jgi:hypothetical protein
LFCQAIFKKKHSFSFLLTISQFPSYSGKHFFGGLLSMITLYFPATGRAALLSENYTLAVASYDFGALSRLLEGEQPYLTLARAGATDLAIQELLGLKENLQRGGWGVPHGDLGREGYLSTDAAAAATTIVLRQATDPDGDNLFAASEFIQIMDTYPTAKTVQDQVNAEVVRINSGYTSGTTLTVAGFNTGGLVYAHKAGAIVQPVLALPFSVGMNGVPGIQYLAERPTAVLSLAVTNPTAGSLTAVWATHDNWWSPTVIGRVTHYDIYVLKHGQGICLYGLPEGITPEMMPSKLDQQPTDSGGNQTVTGITTYYDQTTRALTAITAAGYYYVLVYPKTNAGRRADVRLGAVAIKALNVTSV